MCTEGEQQVSGPASQRVSFDVAAVDSELAGTIFLGKLHHFVSIDSTQTRALADATAGVEAGQVYIADEQTAGRGRGGHTWHSEPDRGLYLTVLVRPRLRGDAVLQLSLAAALAIQSAIAMANGLRVDLRWPNDIVTQGPGSRKLGGVLTEAALTPEGTLRHAAIGIGLNLNQAAMPADLQASATSLLLASGRRTSRMAIAAALLRSLDAELIALQADAGGVLARFAAASSWPRGKRVHVAEDDGYTGTTAGLNEAGLLQVRCDDGSMRTVRHGGVREV